MCLGVPFFLSIKLITYPKKKKNCLEEKEGVGGRCLVVLLGVVLSNI